MPLDPNDPDDYGLLRPVRCCVHCGVDVHDLGEYYMVTNDVWAQSGLGRTTACSVFDASRSASGGCSSPETSMMRRAIPIRSVAAHGYSASASAPNTRLTVTPARCGLLRSTLLRAAANYLRLLAKSLPYAGLSRGVALQPVPNINRYGHADT